MRLTAHEIWLIVAIVGSLVVGALVHHYRHAESQGDAAVKVFEKAD